MKLTPADIDRFWSKVARCRDDECWLWEGTRNTQGYGAFKTRGKMYAAHRVSFYLKHGDIPSGMFVCHRCDNPPCVNPGHFFLGTAQDNCNDKISKGRARTAKGEKAGAAKITDADVKRIRAKWASGRFTQYEIAESEGLGQQMIHCIVSGKNWRHLPILQANVNHCRKLSSSEVELIRREYATGNVMQSEIAARYGVHPSLISLIVNNKHRVKESGRGKNY